MSFFYLFYLCKFYGVHFSFDKYSYKATLEVRNEHIQPILLYDKVNNATKSLENTYIRYDNSTISIKCPRNSKLEITAYKTRFVLTLDQMYFAQEHIASLKPFQETKLQTLRTPQPLSSSPLGSSRSCVM